MKQMESIARRVLAESAAAKKAALEDAELLARLGELSEAVCGCLNPAPGRGGTVFFAGNGGSFSDSIHLAAELVGRFGFDRDTLASIALGTNGSIATAVANDYSYEDVLARELRALARPGDVFVGLSTSGNSENIVRCVEMGRQIGVDCFAMTGQGGGRLAELCPCLRVPSTVTARIQEVHITLGHALCERVEAEFWPEGK